MFEDGEYFVIFEQLEEFYHIGYLRLNMGFSIAKATIKKDNGSSIWARVRPFEALVVNGRPLSNNMVADRRLIFKNSNDLIKAIFELSK